MFWFNYTPFEVTLQQVHTDGVNKNINSTDEETMNYKERWKKQNKLLPLENSIIALTVDQPWLWASRQPEQINETKGNTSMDRLYLLHCDPSKMSVQLCQSPPKNRLILQWSKIQLSIFFPYIWYMLQWYNVVIHTFSKLYPIYSYYEILAIFHLL